VLLGISSSSSLQDSSIRSTVGFRIECVGTVASVGLGALCGVGVIAVKSNSPHFIYLTLLLTYRRKFNSGD
jgi:hypothetical protein